MRIFVYEHLVGERRCDVILSGGVMQYQGAQRDKIIRNTTIELF